MQKKGPADLVTQADFAAQKLVRELVLDSFPDHQLLGEEDDLPGTTVDPNAPRWIVDPLDGTMNYVHGFPHFAHSLALEVGGQPVVGVVFDPMRGECFKAAAGRGAWLNDEPIRASGLTDIAEALATCGFPSEVDRDSPDLKAFLEAIHTCQSIRRTGSAALNLAYLASGRTDVFWSYSTMVWDIAAGVLLVREAGGVVRGPDGGPLNLDVGIFLAAATEPLMEQLVAMVRRAGAV